MNDQELTSESLKAATYYIEKKYRAADLETKTTSLNSFAHGFYAGVKWKENEDAKSTES